MAYDNLFFTATDIDNQFQEQLTDLEQEDSSVKSDEITLQQRAEFTDERRRQLTSMLLAERNKVIPRMPMIKNSKDKVIVQFVIPQRNFSRDLEIPLDITANDFIEGVNEAYNLGIDMTDMSQCYLSCANPVSLIKGKRLLGEIGVRDGSLITFSR